MENKKEHAGIPCGSPPDKASGSPDCPCGVLESQFPYQGKCFNKSVCEVDVGYESLCPYCFVWTSLPEGAALKVTHIFDCGVCGYGKRITEEDK